jgi:ketosteroid isomerase-like protein
MTVLQSKFWILTGIIFVAGAGMVLYGPVQSVGSQGETKDLVGEDIAAIRAVVESYHAALKSGDRESATALLSADVMVLEGGYLETAEEYLSHHLEADMEFTAAVVSEREIVQAVVEENVGWVISKSSSKGDFRGHEIDSAGVELMILRKEDGRWKIRAIHWSSRNRKK